VNETGLRALFALVGACIGSFLNVVVWRLPRGESLVKPRSRCPSCGTQIRAIDNVPVLSWLWLRAKCRKCKAHISARYPFVEALTGALFLLVAVRDDVPRNLDIAAVHALVIAALVAVSFIDWDHRLIPDAITKPGIVAGLLLSLLVPALHPTPVFAGLKPGLAALLDSAVGAAAGAGILLAIRWVGSAILKREAMGLGDVKLLAMIGAFTSWVGVLYSLLVASVAGAVLGGVYVAVRSRAWSKAAGAVVRRGTGKDAQDVEIPFHRLKIRGDVVTIVLPSGSDLAAGEALRLRLVLPADAIWEEADATVTVKGSVGSAKDAGGGRVVEVRVEEPPEKDAERLDAFAHSRLHVPFGPFLAIGGAAMLLYGSEVARFATEWPRMLGLVPRA
jgi:leader peptidase (prepilin peptidase)/N-methyltransferase